MDDSVEEWTVVWSSGLFFGVVEDGVEELSVAVDGGV